MNRRGVTLVELLVVISIIGILMAVLFTAMSPAQRAAMELQERENMRQIHGGLKGWAASNNNRNPIPGLVRRKGVDFDGNGSADRFVEGRGAEDPNWNDHAAMLSLCIMNTLFTPSQLISPNEPSPHVYRLEDYNYNLYGSLDSEHDDRPHRWDPSFGNHLDGQGPDTNPGCNNSYAFIPLAGERRRDNWDRQGSSNFPIIGTRGPMDGDEQQIYVAPDASGPASITGLIMATPGAWRGVLTFTDGHTEIHDGFYPAQMVYRMGTTDVPDNVFNDDKPAEGTWAGNNQALGSDAFLTHVGTVTELSQTNPFDVSYTVLHD
ncbi:MAG: type II secretion system GspH family protein [Phycisphaerales bacterium]|nr:type II secretion system GspH family protein [Phycisphaerales bacterium]